MECSQTDVLHQRYFYYLKIFFILQWALKEDYNYDLSVLYVAIKCEKNLSVTLAKLSYTNLS